MGIAIPGKTVFLIETAPRFLHKSVEQNLYIWSEKFSFLFVDHIIKYNNVESGELITGYLLRRIWSHYHYVVTHAVSESKPGTHHWSYYQLVQSQSR